MLLTPQRLALLAAQGLAEIETVRRVRIGLLSTGSELREPGEQLGPGQIYNSNRIMIRSILASEPWAQVIDYGIIPDWRATLAQTLGEAAKRCDVVVTTGGVSAGDEDHILGALAEHGVELDVLKVAMRPGKPVKIGLMGNVLFAGLPGNPNAALVTFHQIALPAIRATAGIAGRTAGTGCRAWQASPIRRGSAGPSSFQCARRGAMTWGGRCLRCSAEALRQASWRWRWPTVSQCCPPTSRRYNLDCRSDTSPSAAAETNRSNPADPPRPVSCCVG